MTISAAHNPIHVHALIYTGTCGEHLVPLVLALDADPRFRVSVTTLPPAGLLSYWRLMDGGVTEVSRTFGTLEDFLASPGRKVLLLVADWTHPAHAIGAQAVKRARRTGIASISIQHGVFSFENGTDRVYLWDFTSDVLSVWGDWFAQALIDSDKADVEALAVTGNLRLSAPSSASGDDCRDVLGVPRNASVGLLAMATHTYRSIPELARNWDDEKVVRLLRDVLQAMLAEFDRVIIRPHPAEVLNGRASLYVEAARGIQDRVVYSNYHCLRQPDALDVLSIVDCTVTQGSSVGFYSAVKGVPAISLSFHGSEAITNPYPDGVIYREIDLPLLDIRDGLRSEIQESAGDAKVRAASQAFAERFVASGDAIGNTVEEIVALGGGA